MPASMAFQFYKNNIFDDGGAESLSEWITRQTCNHISSLTMSPIYFESLLNQDILYKTGEVVLEGIRVPVGSIANYRLIEAKEKIITILKDMQWLVTLFEIKDKEIVLSLKYQE